MNQTNALIDRRQKVTTVYLSVNIIILGATAFMLKDAQLTDWITKLSTIALVLAGLAACDLWRRLIVQYRVQIEWWYSQLRSMEVQSANLEKLYIKEYEDLYENNKTGAGISRYEIRLTWLFFVIYLIFGTIFVIGIFW